MKRNHNDARTLLHAATALCLLLSLLTPLQAQYAGQWAAHAGGSLNFALGDLDEWFTAGSQIEFGIGQQQDSPWFVEGVIDYSAFSSRHPVTDNSGTLLEEIPLSLRYVGILARGKYRLLQDRVFQPWVSIAGGPHYWRGIRGAISENAELAIPAIPEKVLSEWNMGFRAALGMEMMFSDMLSLDAGLRYRLVIGSLWPTLQEHVELEAVNGFQSLSLFARMNLYF
ncbi:MAG: outer membrane beta-barrel protein [Candidatus Marinimicrobia bacterium]|nr:outer membrane beta-barrel protein [Candidatus Neomarinimicrobiota bacterium]